MLQHCATEQSWKQGFGDSAASVRMTRTQPIVTTWEGFIAPKWFVWQWGARPLEPGKPKTWTTKIWKLSGIRFWIIKSVSWFEHLFILSLIKKKTKQKQQQFLTSHVACNRFTVAFSLTYFPSENLYKRKWSYLFYHGFCRDDLFLVILPNETHSLIITIVVATLSLVNSK